jgi:hypothetical protein
VTEESARAALREALDALIERGETIKVSPTVHDVATLRLFELAKALREESRPDANVESVDGSLAFVLLPGPG